MVHRVQRTFLSQSSVLLVLLACIFSAGSNAAEETTKTEERKACEKSEGSVCKFQIIPGKDARFRFYWSDWWLEGYIVNLSEVENGGNPTQWSDDHRACFTAHRGSSVEVDSVEDALNNIAAKPPCASFIEGCSKWVRVNNGTQNFWEEVPSTCVALNPCPKTPERPDGMKYCNEEWLNDSKNSGYQ